MYRRRAVSLIEVVLALLILGLLAALTVPRLSRAAAPPDETAALRTNLKVLRCAIERYWQDHGTYPGCTDDGRHPAGTFEAFVAQLTEFTDRTGRVSSARDAVYCFGPYLRDGVPPNPLLPNNPASVLVQRGADFPTLVPDDAVGWIYNCDTGQVVANIDGQDAQGRAYITY